MEELNASQTNNNIQLISVISGAVAALAALLAIYLTFVSQKAERNSKRPYFVTQAPGFKKIEDSIRLQIMFINNGVNPAKNFIGVVRIFDENLENEFKIEIDVVNDVPADFPTPYYNDEIILGENMPKHYVYCWISYLDPILKKTYNQEFFMRWDGVQNGITNADFVHANKKEKAIILKHVMTTPVVL